MFSTFSLQCPSTLPSQQQTSLLLSSSFIERHFRPRTGFIRQLDFSQSRHMGFATIWRKRRSRSATGFSGQAHEQPPGFHRPSRRRLPWLPWAGPSGTWGAWPKEQQPSRPPRARLLPRLESAQRQRRGWPWDSQAAQPTVSLENTPAPAGQ